MCLLQKDSNAVKGALDQLREDGWAKRWSSQPYVSRRTVSLHHKYEVLGLCCSNISKYLQNHSYMYMNYVYVFLNTVFFVFMEQIS